MSASGRPCQVHELELAEALATQMSDLDGGTSSVPLRYLAECRRLAADISAARRYLELSRDAEGWDPSFSYSPRVSSSIQSALRDASSAAGNIVVDLPKILEQHLDQALPNRRVFLDYCHLTAEGYRGYGSSNGIGSPDGTDGQKNPAVSVTGQISLPSAQARRQGRVPGCGTQCTLPSEL